ncbi:MAG TPA: alpha-L-fucosidase C-terminal domain-containing protein, partial [Phycisphaerae bacterium]|nr:alpha-L-fucosidase C-terminal domain-containing protein [Phycisphaerae bacterium]
AWMDVNGEAIYGTRALSPYQEGKVRLTQRADGTAFMIYLADEGEERLPAVVSMTELQPANGATISLLGRAEDLPWKRTGTGFIVEVPESQRSRPPSDDAWVFRISAIERAGVEAH